MPDEKIFTPTSTYNNLSPTIKWYRDSKFCLKLRRSNLKEKSNFYSSKYNKFFIVYELDEWSRDLNAGFSLKDCWPR